MEKKYKLTDEDNLSQDGDCWIYEVIQQSF